MVTINKAVCILINALKNSKQQDHIISLLDHSEPSNETLVMCNEWHFYHLTSVEPRYNEPLNNKVLSQTNYFLYPSNSKIMKKNLNIMKPRHSEQMFLSPFAPRYIEVPL